MVMLPDAKLEKAWALLDVAGNTPTPEILQTALHLAQSVLEASAEDEPIHLEALECLTQAVLQLMPHARTFETVGGLWPAMELLLDASVAVSRGRGTAELFTRVVLAAASVNFSSPRRDRIADCIDRILLLRSRVDDPHHRQRVEEVVLRLIAADPSEGSWEVAVELARPVAEARLSTRDSILELAHALAGPLRSVAIGDCGQLLSACVKRGREESEALLAAGATSRHTVILLIGYIELLDALFGVTRDQSAIEEAERYGELAQRLAHDLQPEMSRLARTKLADVLRLKYGATGAIADLNRAIQLRKSAVDGQDLAHPGDEQRLTELLILRYEAFGIRADLTEAIRRSESEVRSLNALPAPDAGEIVSATGLLVHALIVAHSAYGVEEFAESAIDHARVAVEAARSRGSRVALRDALLSLESALDLSEQATPGEGRLDVLVEAKALLTEARSIEGARAETIATIAANLGRVSLEIFQVTKEPQALLDAQHSSEEALARTGPDEPRFARRADHTARVLVEVARSAPQGEKSARTPAELWDRALASLGSPPRDRIFAGLHWADELHKDSDWAALHSVWLRALELLPSAVSETLDHERRLGEFSTFYGIAGATAGSALELDDVSAAIHALETGRNILWSAELKARELDETLAAANEANHEELLSIQARLRRVDLLDEVSRYWHIRAGREPDAHPHTYLRLADRYGDLGEERAQAELLASAALAYRRLGDADRAVPLYQRALSLAQRGGSDLLVGYIRLNLGYALRILGMTEEGREMYAQARNTLRMADDHFGCALAAHDLSVALVKDGMPEEAVIALGEAADLWGRTGERARQATSLEDLALMYRHLGEIGDALDALFGAAELRVQCGERVAAARCWLTGADILIGLEDWDRAFQALEECERLLGPDDPEHSRYLGLLAQIQASQMP